jgi:hypothetical protein
MTQKTNPWTFDVRVRERNLKAGSLTDKDVEKYLSQLPDNAEHAEAFGTAQPALEQPEIADDIADDEGDDEDESEADLGGTDDGSANGAPVGGDEGGGVVGGGGVGGGGGEGGV